MPKKPSPEIKERAPNQLIASLYSLCNTGIKGSEEMMAQGRKYSGGEGSPWINESKLWEQMKAGLKELYAECKRYDELERAYKDEIVNLKKEVNDLKRQNVILSEVINTNSSDSSDEVRVDKEMREILVKILANTENIKQQNKDEAEWLEKREATFYNKKDAMLSNREMRAEIYRTQGEEALREMLREKKYEPSTVDKYIGLAKKDTCS